MPTLNALTAFATLVGSLSALVSTGAFALDPAAVQHEVDEMNQSLPAMVSPVLREEQIRFSGQSLMYTFTRVGAKDDRNLNVTARAYLLRKLCGDADTRQMMREGLTFTFAYVDEGKAPSAGTVVTDRDCPAGAQ